MTPDAAPRTDWPLVALLFIAGLFAAAQFGKVSLALPAWASAYPAWSAQVPLLVSALGAVGMMLGVVAGAQVARFGVRRSLVAALVLGAVASAAQSLTLPVWALIPARLAEGVSHLTIVVAGPTLMAAVASDRDRPVVMALWGMFFGVSFALLALVLPVLLSLGGLPLVNLTQAGGLLVLAALIAPRLPRPSPRPQAGPPAATEGYLQAHRAAYGQARRIAAAAGFVWYTALFLALITYLPAELPDGAGVLLPLISLAGTFAAGWLARRVAPPRIALASFAATIPLMALLWLVPEVARMVVAVPLFLCIGLVPGASFASVPWLNALRADQARANGAMAQLGNVGTTCGTPVLALMVAGLGAGAGIMIFTAVLCLAGMVTVLAVQHQIDRS